MGKSCVAFCDHHTPLKLLEMGKDIFENAIVDTSILLLRNGEGDVTGKAVDMDRLPDKNFPPEEKYWGNLRLQGEKPWQALSGVEQGIMDKIETAGTPDMVAHFLVQLATMPNQQSGLVLSMGTVTLYKTAINKKYTDAGKSSPTNHPRGPGHPQRIGPTQRHGVPPSKSTEGVPYPGHAFPMC